MATLRNALGEILEFGGKAGAGNEISKDITEGAAALTAHASCLLPLPSYIYIYICMCILI